MTIEKMIITDLDGTFVKDSRKVASIDQQSLLDLKETMQVGIATGRSIKEIEFIEEQTGIKADVKIGFNGAVVEVGGERIFEQTISKDSLAPILAYIQEKELVFDALDGDQRIGTHKSEDIDRLWNMQLVEPEGLFELLQQKKIFKINIRPDADKSDQLLEELTVRFPDLAICKSGEKRIEITPKNITKGHALEIVRQHKDLQIFSVGDSENDISMFQTSNYSFCMSHASAQVKQYASTVINNFYEVKKLIA